MEREYTHEDLAIILKVSPQAVKQFVGGPIVTSKEARWLAVLDPQGKPLFQLNDSELAEPDSQEEMLKIIADVYENVPETADKNAIMRMIDDMDVAVANLFTDQCDTAFQDGLIAGGKVV